MANDSIPNLAYAIDFGTSNTVIARWNEAKQLAETVKIPELSRSMQDLPPSIPSLLYVEDANLGKVLTGQQVSDRGLDIGQNPRFFRNFKRGIGAKIQGFLPELDERNMTFEGVGSWFLEALLTRLQADNTQAIDSLVLTVPVNSFETYRHWLTEVCQNLQIDRITMLDEPTAAALGYEAADKELLLVLDFGGGTIDLSLVQLSPNSQRTQGSILKWGQKIFSDNSERTSKTARVLAKAGQNLGGSDLDNWIIDYLVTQQQITKSTVTTRLAEKLKIQLSSQVEAKEVYFDDETLESYELSLNRDDFEQILQQQQFFTRLDELMTRVLQQARRNGVEISDIDAVLLVGGTVQIPAVQKWVEKYFTPDKIRCDRPFTAIATGALQITRGIAVKDFLYHSYGIRYWNRQKNCHSWHPLIQKGQPYPMSQPVEMVLGASVENQPSIELIFGELGAESVATEVYFDGDRLITRNLNAQTSEVRPLNDREGARTIAKLEPLGNPGSDRIRLLLSIDEDRYLKITVEDILTQSTLLNHQIVVRLK
jgi:molecular chaperone DnaK (HSP70)